MAVTTATMTSFLRRIFAAAIWDNFPAAVESVSSTLTAGEHPLSHVPLRPWRGPPPLDNRAIVAMSLTGRVLPSVTATKPGRFALLSNLSGVHA